MCGIAGTYRWPDGAVTAKAMNAEIAHRGPDGDGVYSRVAGVDGSVDVHLAHRRLSIIDLSHAADQPFVKDGLALVYNGELYNYRGLRAELEVRGARFATSSDTEVVLEAWRAWGADALSRFRGMFAFAVHDERTGTLTLARDHFGIKPLLFARRDGGLAFCSELKGLLRGLDDGYGPALRLDPSAMVASLLYYWIPEQHTAVAGVEKLPAGSWAEIRPDGSFRQERWFRVEEELAEGALPPVTVEELRGVLEDSVRAHLVADVPVSSFLSGGLDSSLVTVLARRHNPELDAYTIGFRPQDQRLEAMPDDLTYARMIAGAHGIPLHEIEIAPDLAEMLPRIVQALDEPIGDPAAINTVLICEAARAAGVKVLLSGMGADEIFGGYRKHYACLLAARYRRLPRHLRAGVIEPVVGRLPVAVGDRGIRTARWAKRFVSFASLSEEAAFRRSYTQYGPEELRGMLSPALAPSVDALVAEHAAIYAEARFDDPVNRMCMTDVRMFLPGLNLAYTDRASMAASCEVRVPFVDIDVVRAAFSFAGDQKIRGRVRKAVLKDAAEAWLPKEIVHRPKGLFSAPLRAWVRRDLRVMVDDVLLHGQLVGSGLLDGASVRAMVDADRAGREDRAKEIWQLLSLELWYEHLRSQGATLI